MFTSLIHPRLLAAGLLCACAGAAQAGAVLIDFEAAPALTVVGPTQDQTFYEEGGMRFTPAVDDAWVDLSYCTIGVEYCITNNSSVYLTAFNGAQVTLSKPSAFTLNALDASFYPSPYVNYGGLALGLSLVGTLWDGGTVEAVLALAEDAFPGDYLFSSYGGLGNAFLSSVTFGACLITSTGCVRSGAEFDASKLILNDLAFAIDNLAIGVPEPSPLWLVGLAMAGLSLTRRRAGR